MYGEGGVGEKYELFNFAKPGATIDFVTDNFPQWLGQYYRGQALTIIVNVGGNNSKAEDEPTNYVSTIEEYTGLMSDLLDLLKEKSTNVIAVGNGYVDEAKTNPKPNPLTGGKSYFTNERRRKFSDKTKQLCKEKDITYVDVAVSMEEWIENYVYKDGLHPSQAGHQLIFEAIKKKLDPLL